MTNQQTTQKNDHLVTLVSGMFLAAVLIAAAGFLGYNPVTETTAQVTVQQNETATFTFFDTSSAPATDPMTADITASEQEVRVGDEFRLDWVVDADDAVAFSEGDVSDEWNDGSLGATTGSTDLSESNPGLYIYGVEAVGTGDSVKDTATVEVVLMPNYNSSFFPGDTVQLDGEPGSNTSIDLQIYSEDGYNGQVEVGLGNVSPSISTANGDLIEFTFSSSAVTIPANGSETVTIDMETLLPIRDDGNYTVQVRLRGDDSVEPASDREKFPEFTIDLDGFNPRTIEEF